VTAAEPARSVALDAALRHASTLCFVDDLDNPELTDEDRHHLSSVLRLTDGETIGLSDGRGRFRLATVHRQRADATTTSRRGARSQAIELECTGAIAETPAPSHPITVAMALIKGERSEWAVQKCTELGVDRLVLLRTERTVVRTDGRDAEHRLERLRRIATEAASQSRRTRHLEITGPVTIEELVANKGDASLLVAEPGGRELAIGDQLVAIGPEGGFTEGELARADDLVGLGDTVLRAETAVVAAATLLDAQRRALRANI
jgi:16S rRNA (uracil1498-N3)-methyltransferase